MDRLEQSVSVHDWTSPLSSNQKIAYLQGLVKGRAKEVIQSLGCDGNYYEEAIVELKRLLADPQ